jgi:L-amino acid N-acyltransferase YncA
MKYRIRKGRLADGPAVVEMWQELIDYHSDKFCYDMAMVDEAPDIWLKWYNTHVRSGKRLALVAEFDGRLVGYLTASIESRAELFKRNVKVHIYDTYVVEELRGQGIGTAMMDELNRWVKDKGVDQITVYISSENENGLAFWHASGYKDVLVMGHRDL